MNRRLKIVLITLLIVLLSIISFVGLFVQDTKFMKNLIPEYRLGMDLDGYRAITLVVSDETETVYYDKDGNVVQEEAEDGTSEEVPVNNEEDLTADNFTKTKKIVEQRLSDLGIVEYLTRLDENNGTLTVQIPEDSMTDAASQFLYSRGVFTIEDEDGQVLLDNSNIKRVQVTYGSTSTGTAVNLNIEFNDDSVEKLKEITNTYVESTDEEGNDTSKQVYINIDGSTLLQTSFDEEISNGVLPLTLGTSSNSETVTQYLNQASNIAILLNSGEMPVEYTVDQNRYITSDLTLEDAFIPAIVVLAILVIAFLFLIIKYRKLGLFAVISFIGYVAVLLLAVRYFNIMVTIEGIAGILIVSVLNYMVLVYLLHILKKTNKNVAEYREAFNKALISMLIVLVPTLIIGIILCFATWLPAYSFGTVIFWGVFIMAIYNSFVTRVLFLNSIKE